MNTLKNITMLCMGFMGYTAFASCSFADGFENKADDRRTCETAISTDSRYAKVSNSGKTLADSATEWACVRDNSTGLLWERKNQGRGLHGTYNQYYWYNSSLPADNSQQGWSSQVGDTACHTAGRCDTEKWVEDVNNNRLCGLSGWRLPSKEELASLIDKTITINPKVPRKYFPYLLSEKLYWSSTSYAQSPSYAWGMIFGSADESFDFKLSIKRALLVHSAAPE